ncbi:MAG: type II toxin-antitoxin system VapC family toxin [Chloroflexi bacterium]|nr:MAG: type II toxin-antitoxin system VapC family toxin [Chloroflexota bacterium]
MPVIDAAVLVDALVVVGAPGEAARVEVGRLPELQVPCIFAAEAVSAIRGLLRRGELSPARARAALERIRVARTVQYAFEPFADRVWELRDNVSVYDAWYIALAEWLTTELVTGDARLVGAVGARCAIRLVA